MNWLWMETSLYEATELSHLPKWPYCCVINYLYTLLLQSFWNLMYKIRVEIGELDPKWTNYLYHQQRFNTFLLCLY